MVACDLAKVRARVRFSVPAPYCCCYERKKKKLFKVISRDTESEFANLDLAMAHAKTLNVFVTIKGSEFEIVGMFGVDSVKDGVCPDGIAYDWNKASRIGAPKRVRV